MKKRNLNISFYKAGNGKATRLNIPITWIKEMGITQDDREIELVYDETKKIITIKKR